MFLSLLAVPAAHTAAHADQIPQTVIVSTRAITPAIESPASITVLDKVAIDRAQDIGIADLLLRTPGVTLSRTGGYGSATSLRIRGAETDHTVVVIDGVRLNDPASTGGGYNFGNLLVGDTARIEVMRGPQSILWGSQAIGGVVNIVSAAPEKALEGSFDIEGGSRETINARAALGGITGPVSWRVGAQSFTTIGVSALTPEFGGGERDGYTNRNVNGRLEIALADGLSADFRGYYAHTDVDTDGWAGDSAEYAVSHEFVGYAGLNIVLLDGRFHNRLGYGHTNISREQADPARERATTFDSSGTNERLEYHGSFTLAEGWNLLFGVENERSRFRSVAPSASLTIPLPEPQRGKAEITSFYGQASLQPVANLTLTGGIRHDDHNRFGGKTLFSAGAIWALPTGTVLRASYGEGFKAPSLYQLFSEYGNMGLAPEQAEGWEAGVEQRFADGKVLLGATWFERTTKDQIIYASCMPGTTDQLCTPPGTTRPRWGYYANAARTKAHGIELSGTAELLDGLLIEGNYTWNMAEDRSPGADIFGNWLQRRPRHTANGSISYAWPFGLTTGAAIRRSGPSYEDAANNQRLDGYTLVDLRAEYTLAPQLRLFARAENLFNKDYMTVYRYGTLGRSIHAGVRGRF